MEHDDDATNPNNVEGTHFFPPKVQPFIAGYHPMIHPNTFFSSKNALLLTERELDYAMISATSLEMTRIQDKNAVDPETGCLITPQPGESFYHLGGFLRYFVADVDACARTLLHYVPILFEKDWEQEEIRSQEALKRFDETNLRYNIAQIKKNVKYFLPRLLALSKESLYYIACRIMRDEVYILDTLKFTLGGDYRTRMESDPTPPSLHFECFLNALRTCLDKDIPMHASFQSLPKSALKETEKFLERELPLILILLHKVLFEGNALDSLSKSQVPNKEDYILDAIHMLQMAQGNRNTVKHLVFRILDSSFLNLIETLFPARGFGVNYVKECYHYLHDNDETPEFLNCKENGKRREAEILHFQSLVLAFYPEDPAHLGVRDVNKDLERLGMLSIVSDENSYYIRLDKKHDGKERKEGETVFVTALLTSCFESLKTTLAELIACSDSEHKIWPSQLYGPLKNFIEMGWAQNSRRCNFGHSWREHKRAKLRSILDFASPKTLYYFTHAICKEGVICYDPWNIALCLREFSQLEALVIDDAERDYTHFRKNLRELFTGKDEAKICHLMKHQFIAVLKKSMRLAMWDEHRQRIYLRFTLEAFNRDSTLQKLGARIISTPFILDLPSIIEKIMDEEVKQEEEERKRKATQNPCSIGVQSTDAASEHSNMESNRNDYWLNNLD